MLGIPLTRTTGDGLPGDSDNAEKIWIGGGEGCTPGYWKNNADKWNAWNWPAPYTPTQTLEAAGFVNAVGVDVGTTSLVQALNFKGGKGLTGAEQILLRAAVSALLNSASLSYEYSTAQVISMVNAALATDDRTEILRVAADLDGYNNMGCPYPMNDKTPT